jgi:hypothetical protein
MGTTCEALPPVLLPELVPLPVEFEAASAGTPTGWMEIPVELLQASAPRGSTVEEKVISAHYSIVSHLFSIGWKMRTYIEKGSTRGRGRNDLDGGIRTVGQVELRKRGLSNMGQADDSGATFVVQWNKSDIEAGHYVSDSKVDVTKSPFVRAVVDDAAALKRPQGPIVGTFFLTDTCAFGGYQIDSLMARFQGVHTWELPLTDVVVGLRERDRISTPEWI